MAAKQAPDTATPTTTDVVLTNGTQITVRQADPKELEKFLAGGFAVEETDETPETSTRNIIEQIAKGTDAKSIFGALEVVHAKELAKDGQSKPFRFLTTKYMISTKFGAVDDKLSRVFGIYEIVWDDGTTAMMTCGSPVVMAGAYFAEKIGALSDERVVLRTKETRNGYSALNIALADAPQ